MHQKIQSDHDIMAGQVAGNVRDEACAMAKFEGGEAFTGKVKEIGDVTALCNTEEDDSPDDEEGEEVAVDVKIESAEAVTKGLSGRRPSGLTTTRS